MSLTRARMGWIEISDWSWDIEADTSFLKGAGASVGKPTPGTLCFSHYYDLASPVIMQKIVQGTHFEGAHRHAQADRRATRVRSISGST